MRESQQFQGFMNALPAPSIIQKTGEALVLFIVPDQGASIAVDEVRRHLPYHWSLDSIRLVSELPKTANGKIARFGALRLGEKPYASISRQSRVSAVNSSL